MRPRSNKLIIDMKVRVGPDEVFRVKKANREQVMEELELLFRKYGYEKKKGT